MPTRWSTRLPNRPKSPRWSSRERPISNVSTVTLRTVRAGREAEFEQALREFFQRSRDVPGQLAVHVVRPMPGSDSREWGILRTFQDEQARDEFFGSQLFLEWQAQAAPLMEGERKQQSQCGLEAWFVLPGAKAIIPPPRWKMALMSTLAGCAAGTAVNLTLGASLASLPGPARTLVVSLSVASLMTFVLMPWLNRLLRAWLHPRPGKDDDHD